jgi:hypothetical protein
MTFKKGQSGNPAGRKPSGFARADLFRASYNRIDEKTGKTLLITTIDKIVEAGAMGDIDCAKLGLESALGKVMDEIKLSDGRSKPLDLSKLADKELPVLMNLLKKAEPDDPDPPDEE